MKKRRERFIRSIKQRALSLTLTLAALTVTAAVWAADPNGEAGLQEANDKVRLYFKDGINLMYAIGAVVGIVGAIKVYNKWSQGHPDTGSTAAAWFGSCIFLVVVATVIKSFFGIQ